jgi:tetratricopeptide (TPR) repeat protein
LRALCNRAKSLSTLRRYDEALATTERALALDPRCADAMFMRGMTLVKLRARSGGDCRFENALAVDPQHPHAAASLTDCYLTGATGPTRRAHAKLKRGLPPARLWSRPSSVRTCLQRQRGFWIARGDMSKVKSHARLHRRWLAGGLLRIVSRLPTSPATSDATRCPT